MVDDDRGADRSVPKRSLTEAEVRRFQAAFAVQMCLFTGMRSSEVLRAMDKMTAVRLDHKKVLTTDGYLVDRGRCLGGELVTCSSDMQAQRAILAAKSLDDSSSPYTRVYEDQGCMNALVGHLTALREQLRD